MSILGVSVAFTDDAMEETPTWTRIDVGAVTEWQIDRGKTDEFARTGTGTAKVTLIDQTGNYDPTNVSSPYWGNLAPGKQAAIALQNPVTLAWTTLFRGFVDDWE